MIKKRYPNTFMVPDFSSFPHALLISEFEKNLPTTAYRKKTKQEKMERHR